MSLRGAITLECDEPKCQGELVLEAQDLTLDAKGRGIDLSVYAYGWRLDDDDRLICSSCVAAAIEAEERDEEQRTLRGYTDEEKARI
jgi:hypothetical protein